MDAKRKQRKLEVLNSIVSGLIKGKHFSSDDEMFMFLVLVLSSSFFVFMSISLTFIMLTLELPLLAAANAVVFAGALVFLRRFYTKQKYFGLGLYITLSAMAYTAFATVCHGARYYVCLYYFVIFLMQITVPYARTRVRLLSSVLVWICLMVTIVAGPGIQPMLVVTRGAALMSLFNTNLAFMGILAEITLGNVVREYIGRFNRERMQEMQTRTVTDELTGLYNRRYAQGLPELLRQEHMIENWCVAMADIDDFKNVNDTYGHHTGDRVLQMVADTMRAALRKKDVIIRWGGEEFLILLAETDIEMALVILEKLRVRVQEARTDVDGKPLGVTVTIGVTQTDPFHFESAIQESDKRLYEGKRTGKNKVVS